MGACFDSRTFKASSEKKLKEDFAEYQEHMCNENGQDSYAGHIGIANGLIIENKTFKNENEAHDYVSNRAEKWQAAVAVKVGDFSKVFPVTATEKKEVLKLDELKERVSNFQKDLIVRVKQSKSTQRGCKKCGSKISVKYVKDICCPVCGDHHFIETETDTKNLTNLKVKLKEQQTKVNVMSKKYDEKTKDTYWFVGALCAS